MPIYIEGTEYRHQLGNNVYGLYQNKQTIQKTKKILIYEAEKSSFKPNPTSQIIILV